MRRVLPLDVYQLLEDRLGREDAKVFAEAIEIAFDTMEKRAEALALEKKLEIKDELTKELATKADIARLEAKFEAKLEGEIKALRQEMQTLKVELEGKMVGLRSDLEGKIASLKSDLEGKIASLRMEFRLYFVVTVAVIILSSPRAVDLIGKLLGIAK